MTLKIADHRQPAPTVSTVASWIGGRQTPSHGSRQGDIHNPATGEVIRRVPFATAEDVDEAVKAAERAFAGWRGTTPLDRARILTRFRELLQQHRERIARVIAEEHGKTVADAVGSVQRGIEVVEFAVGVPHLLKGEHAEDVGTGVDCHSMLQPLGVCAGITPFNFPAMVPLWMFPVAIACGNTFVLKPSEKVPSASMEMAALFQEAGLPDGVFNVVHGDKEAVDALLTHPTVRAISFVGSTPVARYIYATAAAHGKRVQALGGAKNHAVVLPDANLAFTADALIGAGFGSSGQRCMSISAVVAVGEIGDALVEALVQRAAQLKVGPGLEPRVMMGPMITAQHRDRIKGYIDGGVAQGATLVLDGRGVQVPGHENGFFVGPTIFDQVSPDMTIYRDEIFGPVLIVLRARSLDEAIAIVNRNPYGNGTAIFTESGAAARRFQRESEVGMVGINVPIPVPMAFFSFGGWKSSLFGDLHMHGTEGVSFYTRTKVITHRWTSAGTPPSPSLAMPVMGERKG
jgi:malonate-semialdehyde dehydrogenase (acetylating) / methylmalonate-semialdehyde dehydrogenase